MTLTTHAIVGAAAASLFPKHPLIAFLSGFLSHFAIDVIPHWDYHLKSKRDDAYGEHLNDDIVVGRDLFFDLFKIGFDFLLGILLSFIFFFSATPLSIILIGALAGILPDAPLQFLYFKIRREPLTSLQRFHIWVHTDVRLRNRPYFGAFLQFMLITAAVALARYISAFF